MIVLYMSRHQVCPPNRHTSNDNVLFIKAKPVFNIVNPSVSARFIMLSSSSSFSVIVVRIFIIVWAYVSDPLV